MKETKTMEGKTKVSKLLLLFGFLHTMLPFSDANEQNQAEDESAVAQAVASPEDDALAKVKLPRKLPTILEIKKAIPPHCFERSLSTSIYFMVKDFFLIVCLYLLSEWTWEVFPLSAQLVITPIFWLLQGTMFTAIFVVGHDATHSSFCKWEALNDFFGNLCLGFLLCPYYMWKLSHRKHHKNTGNFDRDEIFYPIRERDDDQSKVLPGFGLCLGWFGYLIKGYKPRAVEHFNPLDPLFSNHVKDCLLSLLGLALCCMGLYRVAEEFGWGHVLYHHTVPVCIFGCYMVIITFLQHTEDEVPWYSDQLWDHVRGQLSTVDRHYGWCHNIIHSIGTHQVHHLFPHMPHYHLEEATVAFRKAFPKLVVVRHETILPAFYRMFRKYTQQSVIPNDTTVHLYK